MSGSPLRKMACTATSAISPIGRSSRGQSVRRALFSTNSPKKAPQSESIPVKPFFTLSKQSSPILSSHQRSQQLFGSPINVCQATSALSPVRSQTDERLKIRRNLFSPQNHSSLSSKHDNRFGSESRKRSNTGIIITKTNSEPVEEVLVPTDDTKLSVACVLPNCPITKALTPPLSRYERLPVFNDTLRKELMSHGKYRIKESIRVIGQGSFGCVIAVIHDDDVAAVKLVPYKAPYVLREENAKSLNHRNVVRVFEVYTNPEYRYGLVLMDYAGSKTLEKIIEDSKEEIGRDRRFKFLRQVTQGLAECHRRGLLHLDLKPSNVLVNRDDICKIGDFGHSLKENQEIRLGSETIATATYSAPELMRHGRVSKACDVYSLGILMWRTWHRMYPYNPDWHSHTVIYKVVSENVRPVLPHESAAEEPMFCQVIKRCWNKNPERRPTSEDVAEIVHGLGK